MCLLIVAAPSKVQKIFQSFIRSCRYCRGRDVDNSWKPGKYPAVNAIFPAVKQYFFLQNVFKCCQKIVIYLFHLFTPLNLGIARYSSSVPKAR